MGAVNLDLPGMAVRRPVATLMVVLLVILLGSVALGNLAVDLLPNINFPVAIVVTRYSGAGPQEIEQLVTRPVEEAVGTVNRVRRVSSETQEELSVVVCEFNWGTDMDFAALSLREKVDQVKRLLPDDAEDPVVVKLDPALMPCLQLSLSGGRDLMTLRELAEDRIKGRLERLDGVASVQVVGGSRREVQVSLDTEKLQGYGLSISQVAQALRLENLNLPGGRLEEAKRKLLVRTLGQFQSLDDIRRISLQLPSGGAVQVGDLGRVEMAQTEASELARLNGRPSLGIVVQKRPDANTVDVVSRVMAVMRELKAELPPDLEVGVAMDASEYIVRAIDSVISNAIVGAILAVLVLYLFLQHLRSTLVIATSIPVSIVATFTLIYFGGLTLNLMSLGGLALGVGMLVDNSIVVLENIFRHRQEGEDAPTAARRGALEVANAITGSTLTTMAVFLPVAFLQGLASELFRELALTVSFSLLASLVVALTVVPVLASRLLAGRLGGAAALGAGAGAAPGPAAPGPAAE
ncbi:MAG: efflux RND transporter permease subunit, partial [Acetobacteraceae bacterium]|nr:efflux RND transporter permease subunit [Acetobacteraceae bacterium]